MTEGKPIIRMHLDITMIFMTGGWELFMMKITKSAIFYRGMDYKNISAPLLNENRR